MAIRDGFVTLADGRRLAWRDHGAAPARILYIHGFIGSRLEPEVAGGALPGVIALERPGYGWSDPHPAPSLLGTARDLLAGMDRLGIDRFAVVGVSAGGPYATALAHLAPERVGALVVVAGVADAATVASGGGRALLLRWMAAAGRAGMPVVAGLRRLLLTPGIGLGALRLTSPSLRRWLGSPERFQAVTERLYRSAERGLARGAAGVHADFLNLTRPWGFDPTSIRTPAALFYGSGDSIVPLPHMAFYRRHLPAVALARVGPDDHIATVVNNKDQILDAARALARA